MNAVEKKMVEILKTLKTDFGATAVKVAMEAEGILLNEMLRTKEITMAAGVGMTVKIGGCEALTDAKIAKNFGVNALMGPMIESKFALEKYLNLAATVFSPEERGDTRFLINIETLDGYRKIDEILTADKIELLAAVVLGRTDLSAALKIKDVDSPELLNISMELFRKVKAARIQTIVGGGITEKTIPFIVGLGDLLDGFETRKVVFAEYRSGTHPINEAIRQALHFEYLWYTWRQETYLQLAGEDAGRMKNIAVMLGI